MAGATVTTMSSRWLKACWAAKIEGIPFRDQRATAGADKTDSAGDHPTAPAVRPLVRRDDGAPCEEAPRSQGHANSIGIAGQPLRTSEHSAELQAKKKAPKCLFSFGAEGGTRTHTLLRAADFESAASTDSATSAGKAASIAELCSVGQGVRRIFSVIPVSREGYTLANAKGHDQWHRNTQPAYSSSKTTN